MHILPEDVKLFAVKAYNENEDFLDQAHVIHSMIGWNHKSEAKQMIDKFETPVSNAFLNCLVLKVKNDIENKSDIPDSFFKDRFGSKEDLRKKIGEDWQNSSSLKDFLSMSAKYYYFIDDLFGKKQ